MNERYNCCGQGHKMKKEQVDIVLLRYELDQSLREEGSLAADTVQKENADWARQLRDIVDDDVNRAWVTRQIETCVNMLNDKLYPLTKDVVQRPVRMLTNKLTEPELYQISMMVGPNIAVSTLDLIKSLSHQFVIHQVLVDYMKRNNMTVALQLELTTLEQVEAQIDSAKSKRIQPIRRHMHYI